MNSNAPSPRDGGPGSAEATAPKRNSKRPKYSRFTQQQLPACRPILTPTWVMIGSLKNSAFYLKNMQLVGLISFCLQFRRELLSSIAKYGYFGQKTYFLENKNKWGKLAFTKVISTFLFVCVVFIPIGIVSLFASHRVVEIVDQYETECVPPQLRDDKVGFIQGTENKTCNRILRVPKRMNQPIYVYYELENFYQNHRRYVRSRSEQQLTSTGSENNTKPCFPEDIINRAPIVPCGLIAWSLFNDTYSFTRNNQQLEVNKSGISWKSDREHKFGKNVYPRDFQNGSLKGGAALDPSKPLSEQEDLIVWMRIAALPTFRKLYGRIEVDLEADDAIIVTLQNNYNTYSFDGKKKLVLSTSSWIGGRNDFMGFAYIAVGGLCFSMAIVFLLIYIFKPRQSGDPTYLSWSRSAGGQCH